MKIEVIEGVENIPSVRDCQPFKFDAVLLSVAFLLSSLVDGPHDDADGVCSGIGIHQLILRHVAGTTSFGLSSKKIIVLSSISR